jgi:hypothetical protein
MLRLFVDIAPRPNVEDGHYERSLPISEQLAPYILPRDRIATFTYRGFGGCDVGRVFGFDLRDDGARASDAIGDSAARVSDCIVVRPEHRQAHASQRVLLAHLFREPFAKHSIALGDPVHQCCARLLVEVFILAQRKDARASPKLVGESSNLLGQVSVYLDDVKVALRNFFEPRIRWGRQSGKERRDASLYLRQKRKRLLEHVGGHGLILTERRALRNGRALEAS